MSGETLAPLMCSMSWQTCNAAGLVRRTCCFCLVVDWLTPNLVFPATPQRDSAELEIEVQVGAASICYAKRLLPLPPSRMLHWPSQNHERACLSVPSTQFPFSMDGAKASPVAHAGQGIPFARTCGCCSRKVLSSTDCALLAQENAEKVAESLGGVNVYLVGEASVLKSEQVENAQPQCLSWRRKMPESI